MSGSYTIPDQVAISTKKKMTPAYMRPSALPLALVMPEVLTDHMCNQIVEYCDQLPAYRVSGCGAETRECPTPLNEVLKWVAAAGYVANEDYWKFEIDDDPQAWMQTYRYPGNYHKHADGVVGQTRKLTAVALLSDTSQYLGGNLLLHTFQDAPFRIPPSKGTVVVFPAWVVHEVSEMEKGLRQTINMGWFGPPFK